MSKHMPGPWILEKEDFEITKHIVGDGRGICEIFESFTPEMVWANAHLIAAAPDLLEALEKAISRMEQDAVAIDGERGMGRSLEALEAEGQLPEEVVIARATIARARGES